MCWYPSCLRLFRPPLFRPPSLLQAIVAAAVLANCSNFGINLQPLLAFGSISTVAVGFAAQSTMANVVSALQICERAAAFSSCCLL